MRLSVCMIVRNEERFLPECFASIAGVADEIVVVDTGSTDGTTAIAERCGALVFRHEWTNDFSAVRNAAIGHATGDWVLSLDADERLRPGQEGLVRSLMHEKTVYAYSVLVEGSHTVAGGSMLQRNEFPRLFRRHDRIRFEGAVHEQVAPSLMRMGKDIAASGLVIDHLGYDQGLDVVRGKCLRNAGLLRATLHRTPSDAYARYQLGNTLAVLEEYADAKTELHTALQLPTLSRGLRASALNILAEVEIRRGDLEAAVEACEASLSIAPHQALGRWFLAVALTGLERYDRARDVLTELRDHQRRPASRRALALAHDAVIEEDKVSFQLGVTFLRQDRPDEALTHLLDALAVQPGHEGYAGALDHALANVADVYAAIDACAARRMHPYRLLRRGIDSAMAAGLHGQVVQYIDLLLSSQSSSLPSNVVERLHNIRQTLSRQSVVL